VLTIRNDIRRYGMASRRPRPLALVSGSRSRHRIDPVRANRTQVQISLRKRDLAEGLVNLAVNLVSDINSMRHLARVHLQLKHHCAIAEALHHRRWRRVAEHFGMGVCYLQQQLQGLF